MKIAIIGSTQYYSKFVSHKADMEKLGHAVTDAPLSTSV